jgi:hypothetical protein
MLTASRVAAGRLRIDDKQTFGDHHESCGEIAAARVGLFCSAGAQKKGAAGISPHFAFELIPAQCFPVSGHYSLQEQQFAHVAGGQKKVHLWAPLSEANS